MCGYIHLLVFSAAIFSFVEVCNHPDLFELRPIISPFQMEPLEFYTASMTFSALHYDPLNVRGRT